MSKNIIILLLALVAGVLAISVYLLDIKPNNTISPNKQINLVQKESPVKTATSTINLNQSNFSFAVQADPHMDGQSDSQIYNQTLQNIVSAKPAFLIDLGDIFMIDKLADKSDINIKNRYVLMKSYYDLLGSIPLYFAIGNHDGEAGWDGLNTKNYRKEYFPDETYDKNYYSFEKDNALFIVLDPYTYTSPKPGKDGWGWTLGKEQYDWLKTTLENSGAKYKFVFIHHIVGGMLKGVGGVEFVKYYEWGGNNQNGTYGFDSNRSGWGKPIHQLLVDNKVNIVFKGHDHFYAKQELDGVIYQTVPQPSHPGETPNTAGDYGYKSGTILGGSGYLKVQITGSGGKVEFIKADGSIADSYSI
jgi:hypothetical protein